MKAFSLPYHSNSIEYFLRLQELPNKVWLDSGLAQHQHGRFDIISAVPSHCINARSADNLQKEIDFTLNQRACHSDLPFCGGWIGYLNYEARHQHYGLPAPQTEQVFFGWYDWALIQDHFKKLCHLVFHPHCDENTQKQIQDLLQKSPGGDNLSFTCSAFQAKQTKGNYLAAVNSIHEHILKGDCYQTNYTQAFSAEFSGSALGAFNTLRTTVPSPFAAYFERSEDEALLSISPERFIQIKERKALSQPIKGTASRTQNEKQDQNIQAELQASKKNRAENVMIVDLLRNDFNQNCEFFSVKVPQVCELQSFANVHHLVSTVEGTLKENVSHYQFMLDCFPGGSITGAPKQSAMHIINRLEPHRRNIYCGSIGYMSANGNSDFNIAIRTLHRKQNTIECWGGGGIVFDSKPESEFEESLQKVRALMSALETTRA